MDTEQQEAILDLPEAPEPRPDDVAKALASGDGEDEASRGGCAG